MAYDRAVEGTDLLTERIIGAAIEVHRQLGPGLLESTYEQCLSLELLSFGFDLVRQVPISLRYKGNSIPGLYRPDLIVNNSVMIEIKAVDMLASIHEAQLLTYMKHTGIKTGLLMNFNCSTLRRGLRRFSL